MSKKTLVRFDASKPERQSSDFLACYKNGGSNFELRSLKTGKLSEYGLIVFTGRNLTPNDLFAKLIDGGHKVSSVDDVMSELSQYLEQVQSYKVGDVLKVNGNGNLEKTSLKVKKPKGKGLP